MKICKNCGKELADGAVVCPGCGVSQNTPVTTADSSSFGYAFLGFCIPIVGLILYLVWKDTTPLRAKSAGKGALVSVIVSVVIWIIYAVILGAFIATNQY